MVLNLHVGLVCMENCAIILMNSTSTVWITVGCLLLILALVMTVLYFLKSREVVMLKKQCEELRDTMRMMRYEEANLARMLHTAGKPEKKTLDALAPEEQSLVVDTMVKTAAETPDAPIAEAITSVVVEKINETISEEIIETVSANPLVENSDEEVSDTGAEESVVPVAPLEQTAIEGLVDQSSQKELLPEKLGNEFLVTEESQIETTKSVISQTHKQPLNERRSAIPTDLFSAWFAENEDTLVVEETTDIAEDSLMEESPVAQVNQAVSIEESSAETLQPETPERVIQDLQEEVVNVAADELLQEAGLSKDDERFCRKLERIVNTRLRNPNLNIDIIAAQFGIGRTNFYRKVRELTGMSPNDYLRKCRMERAAELLRTTDLPVSEVCVQVGVPDAQYFSKVFKIYFETTPTVYREQSK